MKITNIDEIMARSLRSLAGFCMGECGEFLQKEHYTHYSITPTLQQITLIMANFMIL